MAWRCVLRRRTLRGLGCDQWLFFFEEYSTGSATTPVVMAPATPRRRPARGLCRIIDVPHRRTLRGYGTPHPAGLLIDPAPPPARQEAAPITCMVAASPPAPPPRPHQGKRHRFYPEAERPTILCPTGRWCGRPPMRPARPPLHHIHPAPDGDQPTAVRSRPPPMLHSDDPRAPRRRTGNRCPGLRCLDASPTGPGRRHPAARATPRSAARARLRQAGDWLAWPLPITPSRPLHQHPTPTLSALRRARRQPASGSARTGPRRRHPIALAPRGARQGPGCAERNDWLTWPLPIMRRGQAVNAPRSRGTLPMAIACWQHSRGQAPIRPGGAGSQQ
jgi:hypothetical protein